MAISHIHVKVNPEIKSETEAVLDQIGISMSDLFNMTMRQVIIQRRIPFDTTVPEIAMPHDKSLDSLDDWRELIDKRIEHDNGKRYSASEVRMMLGLEKVPTTA